ncbi:MAG: DUF5615 family PIN-like protein [Deltaproteobacteria bacterium]|nr:DUF5615 family PIN-like protein [Deltaproteobacteria bacterium]
MARFLVDEDLPRSLAPALRADGLDVADVRDEGLRGASDQDVFRHATASGRVLLSADLGFANILRFPLGTHPGMVVARLPHELPVTQLAAAIRDALARLADEELEGNLAIVEPGRIRLRRHG